MIRTSAEPTSAQTALEALVIMKSAHQNNQRIKVSAEGNIYALEKPENLVGKIVYSAKQKFCDSVDRASRMITLLKKMESEVEYASADVQEKFSKNVEIFRQLERSGNFNNLTLEWSDIALDILKHADLKIQSVTAEKSADSYCVGSNSNASEIHQGKHNRSPGTPQFDHIQSLEAMQRNLVTIYQLSPEEASSLTQEVDVVLRNLNCSFREFTDFKRQLLLNPQFPRTLSKKAEISLALAMLPELKQGSPASELADLIGPRLGALQLVQAELPKMDLRESPSFAKEICDRLSEVGFEFYEFGAFKEDLLRNKQIPNNLPKKTEISAAIAVLQEIGKGKSIGDAAASINARLESLNLIQQHVPDPIIIDCVHEGMIFHDPGNLSTTEIQMLTALQKDVKKYPTMTNPIEIKNYPLTQKLEEQFGRDFYRYPPIFEKNGVADLTMKAVTDEMENCNPNASETKDEHDKRVNNSRNKWLEQFIKFFGDESIAKVASHYLHQTTFASFASMCTSTGHSWVDVHFSAQPEIYKESRIMAANLVHKDGEEKCIIRVESRMPGMSLTAINFRGNYKKENLSKNDNRQQQLPLAKASSAKSAIPVKINQMEMEFDVNDMRRGEFNPRILNAKMILNVQLDWQTLDEIIQENAEIERR